MNRVNTRGIDLANKHVLMAALTYNLKKYLKFISKRAVSKAIAMQADIKSGFLAYFAVFRIIFRPFKPIFLSNKSNPSKNIFC